MRERRARVGGRGGGAGAPRGGRGRGRRRRQEGRAAAEGHALVGAHGRAPAAALPARQRAAALRDGAAPRRARAARARAARRVTAPPTPRLHSITGSPECARVPDYCTLANLFIGDAPAAM